MELETTNYRTTIPPNYPTRRRVVPLGSSETNTPFSILHFLCFYPRSPRPSAFSASHSLFPIHHSLFSTLSRGGFLPPSATSVTRVTDAPIPKFGIFVRNIFLKSTRITLGTPAKRTLPPSTEATSRARQRSLPNHLVASCLHLIRTALRIQIYERKIFEPHWNLQPRRRPAATFAPHCRRSWRTSKAFGAHLSWCCSRSAGVGYIGDMSLRLQLLASLAGFQPSIFDFQPFPIHYFTAPPNYPSTTSSNRSILILSTRLK